MPDNPSHLLGSLPFTIKKVSSVNHDKVEVTLELSREFAEQLTLISAPLMRDLANSIERQKQSDSQRMNQLQVWQDARRKMFWVALKVLRQSRKTSQELQQCINMLAIRHNISPEQLRIQCDQLKRTRQQKLSNLRSLAICRLYLADVKKGQIAKRFGVSVWVVNKTLDTWLPRLTPQIGMEVRHG